MCIGCHKVKSFIIFEHAHILSLETDNKPFLNESAEGRRKTVEIISWSISTKVWDRAGIKLAIPESAVRHASVARHVTDCTTRPGRASFLLIFLFTFGFTFRKHTGNISISEIAISYLFWKTNVSIKSSLILQSTNAVLGLVRIWYYSIALGLFRPRYAIVTVKQDKCRNRVNIG